MLPGLVADVPNGEALLFAPERTVRPRLENLYHQGNVVTADFYSADVDYPGEDIQALTFADGRYSLIICNHVLEHVRDDGAAIAECARVLQSDGTAVFTIPGDFWQQKTAEFDAAEENGHVRHYGMDVIAKLERSFGIVSAIDMSCKAPQSSHVRSPDYAFVCRRPTARKPAVA